MPEVTETEVRIPNTDYKVSDFDAKWGYRVIALSEEQGIRALIGRLKAALPATKTAVRTFIFLLSKGWDMTKAQAWVSEHKASLSDIPVSENTDDLLAFLKNFREQALDKYGAGEFEAIDEEAGVSVAVNMPASISDVDVSGDNDGIEQALGSQPPAPNEVFLFANNGKLEVKNGLVWKHLLRVGKWPGEESRGEIEITWSMLEDIKKSYEAGVMPSVPVPLNHTDEPDRNAGFVKSLEVRKNQKNPEENGLWCGIQFTDNDIEDKVKEGTIQNVSAMLRKLWQDVKTGKKWPWVLWHVALTNLPLIPDLKPFLASVGATEETCFRYSLYKEVKPMDDKEKIKDPTDREKALADELEVTQGALKSTTEKYTALEDKMSDMSKSLIAFELQMAEQKTASRKAKVESICLALQGQGKHERVAMPEGYGFAPVIIASVKPLLMADDDQDTVRLSLESDTKGKITDVVLTILNSIAKAKDGGMLCYTQRGVQVHTEPVDETSPADKDAKIDAYLKDRHIEAPKLEV